LRNVDAKVTKQIFKETLPTKNWCNYIKTLSLLADISGICVWLDNRVQEVRLRIPLNVSQTVKGSLKTGLYIWKLQRKIEES
jgi:hypothetical protein